MKAYHTTSRFGLEQLEQRRMLSADLSPMSAQPLDASSGPVFGDQQVPFADAAARTQVPFKGSLEGVDTTTPLTPPFVSAMVEATGEATQLGKFTYTILATVNRATGMATGTFLFTAANGDSVFGTLSGQSTLTAPGVLTIVENMIITGGTGRFAGSTGSFTETRLKNLVTSVTTGSFEGTISSPGSTRTLVAQASPAPNSFSSDQISAQQPDSSAIFGGENAQQDQAIVFQVLE